MAVFLIQPHEFMVDVGFIDEHIERTQGVYLYCQRHLDGELRAKLAKLFHPFLYTLLPLPKSLPMEDGRLTKMDKESTCVNLTATMLGMILMMKNISTSSEGKSVLDNKHDRCRHGCDRSSVASCGLASLANETLSGSGGGISPEGNNESPGGNEETAGNNGGPPGKDGRSPREDGGPPGEDGGPPGEKRGSLEGGGRSSNNANRTIFGDFESIAKFLTVDPSQPTDDEHDAIQIFQTRADIQLAVDIATPTPYWMHSNESYRHSQRRDRYRFHC
jgi:hypothetical protein